MSAFTPTVSVIVPTFERAALLDGCLRALDGQRGAPSFEVVVVDDASRDSTRELLSRWNRRCDWIRVLSLSQNAGPAAARNAGISVSSGDVLAFTDDDCEPEPSWLGELVGALMSKEETVVGVGGRVVAAGPGLIGEYMTRNRILEPPPSLGYLVTANCAYQREPVIRVGGFDSAIRNPGGEDPGLSLALRRRGYGFGYCERAVVRHHYRESLVDFVKTFYRYGKGCGHVLAG